MNRKSIFIILTVTFLFTGCITSKSNLEKSPCACNSKKSVILKG